MRVARGARIYAAGCLGEPSAIFDAVTRDPEIWRDVRITGAFIPGVGNRDISGVGVSTTAETIFATEALRPGRSVGAVELLPLHYTTYYEWLATPGVVDIAFFNVTSPRSDGTVGLGPSADFSPAALAGGARTIGIINSNLPDVFDGARVPVERFDAFVEDDSPLPGYDAGAADPTTARIAEAICDEIEAGDTVQLGLGKLQAAILHVLQNRRDLGFHGGMLSGPFLAALDNGAFSRGVTSGVALGDSGFLRAVAKHRGIRFRPVGFTHAISTIAAIPRFVSINSVLEIDLFGQANGEFMDGVQVSGHGGMVDFVRGARASAGGRSFLALPATARGGTVSRIVPALRANTAVSIARSDVDRVATEHGVANLRHAGIEERAQALMSIAAPQFRDNLAAAWDDIRMGRAREES